MKKKKSAKQSIDVNNPNNANTLQLQEDLDPIINPNEDILSSVLTVHAKLFEKHRIMNMKKLFYELLWHEITYHSQAVEAYSQLLECLSVVDDSEYFEQLKNK
jgi:hypothetical protein